jgi:hypothetical protein
VTGRRKKERKEKKNKLYMPELGANNKYKS